MAGKIIIKSLRPDGHYRARRFHGPEGTAWSKDEFTQAELAALVAIPGLRLLRPKALSQNLLPNRSQNLLLNRSLLPNRS